MVIASPTNVSNKTHHDPFGMLLVGRNIAFISENYKFGFNGQEQDDEVYGDGKGEVSIDTGLTVRKVKMKCWENKTQLILVPEFITTD